MQRIRRSCAPQTRRAPRHHCRQALALVVALGACVATSAFRWSGGEKSAWAVTPKGREQLLRLLQSRPRGMSREAWREQRREAVRELGRRRDRQAVPALLQIVRTERFDVILEIAIDALGRIRDRRATGTLKRLLADPSLDGYVRDAAASALKRIAEASSSRAPPTPRPASAQASHKPAPALSPADRAKPPALGPKPATFRGLRRLRSQVPQGLIALDDRLEIGVGSASLRRDTGAAQTSATLHASCGYRRQVEKASLGYSLELGTGLDFDFADPPQKDATWNIANEGSASFEMRAYPFLSDVPRLFGQISGLADYAVSSTRLPLSADKRFHFGSSVGVALGPGYGRIFDVGPTLRLRRVLRVLRQAGLLKQRPSVAIANQIRYAWYALRNEIGSYQQLGHLLRVLHQAKLLLAPVDAATTYRLVRILDDPQLIDRYQGLLARAGVGAGRRFMQEARDRTALYAYGQARFTQQRGTTRAIVAELDFGYDFRASPDVYNIGANARYDWYFYNRAFDPLGRVSGGIRLALGNLPGAAFEDASPAVTALATMDYTRFFSRGSRISLQMEAGVENGGLSVLIGLSGSYGINRGVFNGTAAR